MIEVTFHLYNFLYLWLNKHPFNNLISTIFSNLSFANTELYKDNNCSKNNHTCTLTHSQKQHDEHRIKLNFSLYFIIIFIIIIIIIIMKRRKFRKKRIKSIWEQNFNTEILAKKQKQNWQQQHNKDKSMKKKKSKSKKLGSYITNKKQNQYEKRKKKF